MKKFWDFKAKKYPKAFELGVIKETSKIIDIINKMGIDFSNKNVIDIGCGTGIYGLFISKEAKNVLCLDISDKMIRVLKKEIKKYNIKNVNYCVSDFKYFNCSKYQKKFDIAFASMTPAIKNENDVLKMENLSKKYCVYIGWAGKRKNNLLDDVYSFFGLKPHIPRGFFNILKIIKKNKRDFHFKIYMTSWKWEGSVDEAVDDFSLRMEMDNYKISRNEIKKFLISKYPSGFLETITYAKKGIIVWKGF